jgi:pimeloyl-ACP methyl ester carboxylesterase
LARFFLVICAGLAGFATYGKAAPAHAQAGDPTPLLRWWDAENQGDADSAAAQFADNAIYIGTMPFGNCSANTPCTDIAGIRQQLQRNTAIHFCTTIRRLQISGDVITGEREIYSDYDHSIGIKRVVQDFLAVVQGDKITFAIGVLNSGDLETARALAIDAGTEPAGEAVPAPATACARLI